MHPPWHHHLYVLTNASHAVSHAEHNAESHTPPLPPRFETTSDGGRGGGGPSAPRCMTRTFLICGYLGRRILGLSWW